MAYQSLYRRYRPRRFGELRGQEHVVRALRNAVRDDRVGHAYLFSGPRGTGKTTTARILAKVLNCTNVVDGEPCCACDSCLAVEHGTSFDVFELDAASNRGIENIRELIGRAELGTPGRRKVYILDEVHMLTKEASATLLKTLEEPPEHVVFVLATTDPQKVLPTIRSRTQHLEFHLIPAAELADQVRDVIRDAGLEVPESAVATVVRMGAGSSRDTLSALEQVASAGGLVPDDEPLDDLVDALADHDTSRALAAVARAVQAGRDPRTLAEHLVAQLRDAFLLLMAPEVVELPDAVRERLIPQAQRLGSAGTVRAIEVLGATLVDLRQSPDPRLLLDVALVRLTNPAADTSNAALLSRIEKLERALAAGGTAAPPTFAAPAEAGRPGVEGGGSPARAKEGPGAPSPSHPAAGRASLGSKVRPLRRVPDLPADDPEPAEPAGSEPSPAAAPVPAAALADGAPSRDALTLAWADQVLPRLKALTRARFAACRWADGPEGPVLLAPNAAHRDKCLEARAEVEAALAAQFGRPVPLRVEVDTEPPPDDPLGPGPSSPGPAPARAPRGTASRPRSAPPAEPTPPPPPAPDDDVDLDEADLVLDETDPLDRVIRAFPGAELVDEEA